MSLPTIFLGESDGTPISRLCEGRGEAHSKGSIEVDTVSMPTELGSSGGFSELSYGKLSALFSKGMLVRKDGGRWGWET